MTRLIPVLYDKHGPIYSQDDAVDIATQQVNNNTNYFYRRAKIMASDIDNADTLLKKATRNVEHSLDIMLRTEKSMASSTKDVVSSIKDTTNKLGQSLAKIEKLANFDRLERYVNLLERAEKSMTVLAELESSGKLDKIAGALR